MRSTGIYCLICGFLLLACLFVRSPSVHSAAAITLTGVAAWGIYHFSKGRWND